MEIPRHNAGFGAGPYASGGYPDPGPDFAALARRAGLTFSVPEGTAGDRLSITHGTTCVALRYADGAIMAGDRRATSGNFISHRSIEKVFPADEFSCIEDGAGSGVCWHTGGGGCCDAGSGPAGPALLGLGLFAFVFRKRRR